MKLFSILLIGLALAWSGCSTASTQKNPRADFSKVKRVYVEHRLADDHRLDRLIVAELERLGREASSGPMTMMPDGVDAVITYSDDWAWDFKSYLSFISIQVRDYRRDVTIGQGMSRHASPLKKTPEQMIRQIIEPLFK